MPDNRLYILASEALDLDSLASALLFAEFWAELGAKLQQTENCTLPPKNANHHEYKNSECNERQQKAVLRELAALKREYAHCALCFLLPLQTKQELLWRRDIAYLLQFLNERDLRRSGPLDCLEQLFARAHCSIQFCEPRFYPQNSVLILLDRHHLPESWDLEADRTELDSQVLAIFDHRPDSGSLAGARIRHIQTATSCVSVMIKQLFIKTPESAGFAPSEAAALLCLGALHLDRQQYGSLQPWEQSIWQGLVCRLSGSVLRQLETILQTIAQKRHEPDLNLFEQANSDVKIAAFMPENFSVAVATVPFALQALRELAQTGELAPFVRQCLKHQQADFLILLHRQKNPCRALSFCFISNKMKAPNLWEWNATKIEFFLKRLHCSFPFQIVYPVFDNSSQKRMTPLVQAEQEDQSLSRKAFMPALRKSFCALLQSDA